MSFRSIAIEFRRSLLQLGRLHRSHHQQERGSTIRARSQCGSLSERCNKGLRGAQGYGISDGPEPGCCYLQCVNIARNRKARTIINITGVLSLYLSTGLRHHGVPLLTFHYFSPRFPPPPVVPVFVLLFYFSP